MWNRLNVLIAIFVFSAFAAVSFSSAQAAEMMVASGKNPCALNPCAMKANPCAASNPCAANPCSMKANPCSVKNPCASSSLIPLRDKAITSRSQLKTLAKKLWNDTSLGTAGVSCSTCHPRGKGLKKRPFPKYVKMPNDIVTMDQMINYCILNPMKGKALAWNSQEMTGLAAYVSVMSRRGAKARAGENPCGTKQ